ncbi:hypothetical protein KEM54_002368 [Ascosphaera aggregata]|nr:hypothetical protein KEM54_002368 [Ascosphaera aggregata]
MVIRLPGPGIDIPNVDIFEFVLESKRPFPDDKVIFQDAKTGRTYTRAGALETAIGFGKGLKALWNWKKRDVFAVISSNNIDVPAAIWGTFWAGGAVTTVNPTYTAAEMTYQLKLAKAKAIATQYSILPVALKAAEEVGIPKDRIVLLGDQRDPKSEFKHFTSIRNISGASRFRRTRPEPEDVAFIVFSSGTTGLPKGVMLSHRNLVANILQNATREHMLTWNGGKDGSGDKIIADWPRDLHMEHWKITDPQFPIGLTVLVHMPMFAGLTAIVMPKFNLEEFCANVQKFQATYSFVAPPIVLALARSPVVSKYDLSSLRMLNCGAAPLKPELSHALTSRIKTLGIKQGYGLSETSPTLAIGPWEDWEKHTGSAGVIVDNIEVKIMSVGEEDAQQHREELPFPGTPEMTGEVFVRGPNIFIGYLDNPKATAECLDKDGWFRTGDIGYVDSSYRLYITDRLKELIKYKGYQVPPAELEDVLLSSPAVLDAAVVGVPVEDGEIPRGYVVPADPSKTSEKDAQEIMDWVAQRVVHYKRLRGGVKFIKAVPKSVSGKILRRVLKDEVEKEANAQKTRAKL